jgi:hypothetical protein
MKVKKDNTKKIFIKLGSCSQTYFHIVNSSFNNSRAIEERAADPLVGGIYRQGYQCRMLWGSSMAVGTEAHQQFDDRDQAIGVTIKATQCLLESFKKK